MTHDSAVSIKLKFLNDIESVKECVASTPHQRVFILSTKN